jgi:hypothetical protein
MSFQVTEAFVQSYRANFRQLAQQRNARLRAWCTVNTGIVGQSDSIERIGATNAYDITSRHADTKYVDTQHSRRWVDMQDKGWADLVDKLDKIKMLADPTSEYLRAGVMALNRSMDDIVIAAARGNARTNAGLTALPSTQKIAVSATNLTLAKLLSTKEILDQNEVDEEQAEDGQNPNAQANRVMVVNTKMLTSLYGTTEIKSIDYNSVKALAEGKIDTFLGFKFVRSERLPKDGTATTGYALAWSRGCMGLGIGEDIQSSIDVLPTKNYSVQVFASMSLGGVRVEDEGVVEIACA